MTATTTEDHRDYVLIDDVLGAIDNYEKAGELATKVEGAYQTRGSLEPQADRVRSELAKLQKTGFKTIRKSPTPGNLSRSLDHYEDTSKTMNFEHDHSGTGAQLASTPKALAADALRAKTIHEERASQDAAQGNGSKTARETAQDASKPQNGQSAAQDGKGASAAQETGKTTSWSDPAPTWSEVRDRFAEVNAGKPAGERLTYPPIASDLRAENERALAEHRAKGTPLPERDTDAPAYDDVARTARANTAKWNEAGKPGRQPTHQQASDELAADGRTLAARDRNRETDVVPKTPPVDQRRPDLEVTDRSERSEPVVSETVKKNHNLDHRVNEDRSVTYADKSGKDVMTDRGDGITIHDKENGTEAAVALAKERFPKGVVIEARDDKQRDALLDACARQGVEVHNPELREQYAALRTKYAQQEAGALKSAPEKEQVAEPPAAEAAPDTREQSAKSALAQAQEKMRENLANGAASKKYEPPQKSPDKQIEP